jgi:hypothetical protein
MARKKYMMMGGAIIGGEHSPMYAKEERSERPRYNNPENDYWQYKLRKEYEEDRLAGEVGAANFNDLMNIVEEAIILGLKIVFTPRQTYGQIKQGLLNNINRFKEEHPQAYEYLTKDRDVQASDELRHYRLPHNNQAYLTEEQYNELQQIIRNRRDLDHNRMSYRKKLLTKPNPKRKPIKKVTKKPIKKPVKKCKCKK